MFALIKQIKIDYLRSHALFRIVQLYCKNCLWIGPSLGLLDALKQSPFYDMNFQQKAPKPSYLDVLKLPLVQSNPSIFLIKA